MAVSPYPSKVCLPKKQGNFTTVVDFLSHKFPAVAAEQWQQRAVEGKLHWLSGEVIELATVFRPDQWVCYYREVAQEPIIPFAEQIVHQDDHVLIVYKPHFLPVMPTGDFVTECLQNRLRKSTGIDDLVALHRLDRETAGLVMFSNNTQTRPLYHELFSAKKIQKNYQAVASINIGGKLIPSIGQQWVIKNRLVKSQPSFLMRVADGQENSHTVINCIDKNTKKALFELQPITGKTHQLRVHMQSLGWPLLNDRFYPELLPKNTDIYAQPLQLLARQLSYIDPVTEQFQTISCSRNLTL